MKLALDTTLNSGSIALADEERVLYSAFFDIRITHSETLMPAIDHALKFCGYQPADIHGLYVCVGPGSFTGLRIGLATAKGIAYGLGIPLFAFSSLELAALSATGLGKPILSVIDAKMKEVYFALYDPQLKPIIPPQVGSPQMLATLPGEDMILCGSGAGLAEAELVKANRQYHRLHDIIPSAAAMFDIARLLPEKCVPCDLAALEPLYLRESTAQIKQQQTSH